MAPRVTRAAVLRDTGDPAGIGQWGAIQTAAPSFGVELRPVDMRDAGEIERSLASFAGGSTDGLIVTSSAPAAVHRDLIIALAARHQLPAVYPARYYTTSGGLISYGPIRSISTGAPPVTSIASSRARSQPICRCRRRPNTSLVINLKTAKVLGLDVPATLLARADEVIE